MVWKDTSQYLDTDTRLKRCPFCDSIAGFRKDVHGDIRAECSNGGCGIATPYHYKTVELAIAAWNRRAHERSEKQP